ncbi:hypothetical protein K469DRAFT_550434, partial [Zopfia rhizophila CBS 207.26]
LSLSIELTYNTAVAGIKVSIILLYLRFAGNKIFRLLCVWTIALVGGVYFISQVVCLVQCVPVSKNWDYTGKVKGHCIRKIPWFFFSASFNVVTDIWILALPAKTLLSVKIRWRDKAMLFFIFGMGAIPCVASIVRLHTPHLVLVSRDPLYDTVPINIWSMIEVNVAIMCASAPGILPCPPLP